MPVSSLRPNVTGTNTGSATGFSGAPTAHQAVADESDVSWIGWSATPIIDPTIQRFGFDNLPIEANRVVTHDYRLRHARVIGSFAFAVARITGVEGPGQNPGVAPSAFVNFSDIDLVLPISVDAVNTDTDTGMRLRNTAGFESWRTSRIEWLVTWAGAGGSSEVDAISVVLPILFGLGRGLNLFCENMAGLEKLFRRTIGDDLPGRLYFPCLTHPELAGERERLLWAMFREPKFAFFGGK